MIYKLKKFMSTVLCFLLTCVIAQTHDKDIDGSEDHPLISRYPGSYIYAYSVREFDEYILPVASLEG